MALQAEYVDNGVNGSVGTGATYPNAYHRIVRDERNFASAGAQVVVAIYVDQPARDAGRDALREVAYAVPVVDPVSRADLYAALKKLPYYASALDV